MIMNKWLAILLIYLGSCCYTFASFYHLSFEGRWSFWRAYALALAFVAVEYIFNVLGNKGATRYITVFQIMILIVVFDFINLAIINAVLLKNDIHLKDVASIVLMIVAMLISLDTRQVRRS